ncbi:hypothetical protein LINPERPRIM_LOCUS2257 [Linum perenne]
MCSLTSHGPFLTFLDMCLWKSLRQRRFYSKSLRGGLLFLFPRVFHLLRRSPASWLVGVKVLVGGGCNILGRFDVLGFVDAFWA